MERLVDIIDIYDFSDITDENANPYNFHNDSHYNDSFARKVVDVVWGEDIVKSDLGVKLTQENIVEYLCKRKEKFEDLIKEYESTGTIEYQSYDSDSRFVE